MKLVTLNGELDLPEDFSFEIELNNPFLSDEGDASVPASIPATPNNLKVLDNIHRVDRANRFVKSVPATLMAGTIQKHGQLIIDTLNMKDGISVSLAVENSDLYSQYKGKSLKEIFSSKVRDDWNRDISALANYLIGVYFNRKFDDFAIFPVAVAPYEENATKIYQYNNEREGNSLLWRARTVREGDLTMSVTDGYGLSPFLYLYKMIDLLFQEMGYYVIYNCLDKDPYRDIVLLNNCSDTIVKGVINYSDLVPSCTLSEFIDFLFNKFGIHVRVDSTSRRVSVVTLQELFDSAPTMDITTKVVEELGITIEDSSRVVLSSETSIDGTAPAAETFDKLIERYGYYIEVTEQEYEDICNNNNPAYSDCLIMRQETGQFYELRRKIGKDEIIPKFIGTNYFKYDRSNTVNQDSHSSPDVMPAIIYDKTPFMYIGERLHYNTSYQNTEDTSEQSIMIAWKTIVVSGSLPLTFGTTQKYFDGRKIKDFSLTAYDMYEYFWSKYNNLLRNGKVSLRGTVLYDVCDLSSLDMTKIKIYRGQKILPLKTVFEVSDKLRNRESEFILVKEYLDSVKDNMIVPETKQKYKWAVNLLSYSNQYNKLFNADYPRYYDNYGNCIGCGLSFNVIQWIENYKSQVPDWYNFIDNLPHFVVEYVGCLIDIKSDINKTIYLGTPNFINEVSPAFETDCEITAKSKAYKCDNHTGEITVEYPEFEYYETIKKNSVAEVYYASVAV